MTYYNVTHGSCDDGAMSAAIVKKFVPDAVIVFTGYDDGWKDTEYKEGDKILFTDYCPKPEDLWDLYERKIEFTVLDHHITAVNSLDKYWENEPQKANIIRSHCKLDLNGMCGATMTWKFFTELKGLDRPLVLEYIEIADTWKWERDPNAKYVTQYIRVVSKQGSWEDMAKLLDEFDVVKAVEQGKLLVKRLEMDVEDMARKSHKLYIEGIEVESVNSGHALSISDLGHALAKKAKNGVGCVYNYSYGEMKMSFRGLEGTTIAREVAEKLGGGGHNSASGARMTIDKFLTLLQPSK